MMPPSNLAPVDSGGWRHVGADASARPCRPVREIRFRTASSGASLAMATWVAMGGVANASAGIDTDVSQKAAEILDKMTLEEKASLCHGNSTFYLNAIPRVGIETEFSFSDGPHNVRAEFSRNSWARVGGDKDYSTSLPPLTALAATWDPALAGLHGTVIGREARDRGKDCMLGPGVNIMRTPLNGRNFEYMGEDPALASAMVVPLIRAIQAQDVAACVKHYAFNDQELNRMGVNVEIDERTMREIYLPPFRAAVVDAGVLAVMSGYNKVLGEHCSHSDFLNNQILKKEWGFKGFVVTDWGSLHDTVKGALGGTDVEMDAGQSIRHFKQPLLDAVKSGAVPASVVDDKARRVLHVMAKIKKFNESSRAPGARNTPDHQKIARQIAESAIVLLKNESGVLPIDKTSTKRILVVGNNAVRKHCTEGGSADGKPLYEITPLEGIKRLALPGTQVEFMDFPSDTLDGIPASCLATVDPAAGVKGWKAEFFNNAKLDGEPVAQRYDASPSFDWKGRSPMTRVNATHFSARWTTTVVAPETGVYQIGFTSDDGARVFIDDKPVLSQWRSQPASEHRAGVSLEAGKSYRFRVEYFQEGGQSSLNLGWRTPSKASQPVAGALAEKARAADAVIVFTGNSHDHERESGDRQNLRLPGNQDSCVAGLLAAQPRTVVVNLSGAPVEMPWVGNARTLVQYWFAGQEGGNAIAGVLFGDVNPSGKLPFSFPVKLADSPAHAAGPERYNASEVKYSEGVFVGYRWFDSKQVEPMFPFGHGLSYTKFALGKPELSSDTVRLEDKVRVVVPVTNTGKRAGAEVVQLYVSDTEASVPRPPKELKHFRKVHLQPGESTTVTFVLGAQDLSFWDVGSHGWKAEPGRFLLHVGTSSRQLPHSIPLELR